MNGGGAGAAGSSSRWEPRSGDGLTVEKEQFKERVQTSGSKCKVFVWWCLCFETKSFKEEAQGRWVRRRSTAVDRFNMRS